jgi:hypothetical protein
MNAVNRHIRQCRIPIHNSQEGRTGVFYLLATVSLPCGAANTGTGPRQARVGTIGGNQALHATNHFCMLNLHHKFEYNYDYDFYTSAQ